MIGSVLLRFAVSLSNRSIGRPAEPNEYVVEDDDDWGDYPIAGSKPEAVSEVIPTPGLGKGMWIILCVVIVNAVIVFAIQMAFGEDPGPRRARGFFDDEQVLSRLATLPISFLIVSGLFSALLPTGFTRGLLVAFYYLVIGIGIAVLLALPIFALGVVFR